MQLHNNNAFNLAFKLLGILAIPTLLMQIYADFYLFIGFGKTLHLFVKFIVPSIPFYLFWVGLSITAFKNIPKYLWLSPIFFILILHTEGRYLYILWTRPNVLTFEYTKILAILSCTVVSGALILFILSIKDSNNKLN